ncbi:hemerythrin domain-containing protein [Ferrovibrio sp.]|uniref:hemerythrin domain-containing protein n=1 Tax=Ferrovibrio sp. TaxID=1917215 RepID=UPI0025C5528A|nr:hemerythrin domain-containing protein [Ferrovibrio sp.]MBX3454430.1 hemerythrin domain-containing protein [Ferrovibrio sp.]
MSSNSDLPYPQPATLSPGLRRIHSALTQSSDAEASPFETMLNQRMALLSICAMIDRLPLSGPDTLSQLGPALAAYLRQDFPAIVAEEEEGLLPLLRQRLLLGDDLEPAIRQLSDEHRRDTQRALSLAAECDALAEGLDPEDVAGILVSLAAFAEQQRRHLAWEEAIILPVARARLTEQDLRSWNRAMRARKRLLS